MDSVFQSFVSKFGELTPHLTFIVICMIVIFYFFKDTIAEKIKEMKLSVVKLPLSKEKKEVYPIKQKTIHLEVEKLTFDDLNAHDLFNVIEDVRSVIKFHKFDDDSIKTQVFHDFINIMLDEIKQSMKVLIVQIGILDAKHDPKRDELKQVIMTKLGSIVESYCKEGEAHFLNKGLTRKDAEYVVNLFEEWRSETRRSINDRINAIFASSFHQTNFARVLAVYELISVSVSLIPKDGIRSFEQMNGRLKSIKYE